MVFSRVVEPHIHSYWNVNYVSLITFYACDSDEEYYILHRFCTVYTSLLFVWFIMQMNLMVSESMEPVKSNNFVMFISFWRVEADADSMLNITPETFASMGFGV